MRHAPRAVLWYLPPAAVHLHRHRPGLGVPQTRLDSRQEPLHPHHRGQHQDRDQQVQEESEQHRAGVNRRTVSIQIIKRRGLSATHVSPDIYEG